MYELALVYYVGDGTEKDLKQFFYWVKKAAEAGVPEAMRDLAYAYHEGEGTEKNLKRFFDWMKKAAEAGVPKAMRDLAYAYHEGKGTKKDLKQFFDWMKKAAEAGMPKAMHDLARAYHEGEGTEKDLKQFFSWVKKAAEAGVPEAMHELAGAYNKGQGIKKDSKQFFYWVKKAAEADVPKAMYDLALAYHEGEGTKKDLKQFFYWVKKAVEAGVLEAMHGLALAYHEGDGTEKDLRQFFSWAKKAAEADLEEAMLMLANAYGNGEGTEKDPKQFFYWVKKAAEANMPKAMLMLALCYSEGEGTEKDLEQLIHWTMKAAKAGMRDAMFILAFIYSDGYGTERDWERCLHWMEKYSKEENVEADAPLFFNLTEKMAEEGEPKAMFILAFAYVMGDDTKENLDKYLHWIEKAYGAKSPHAFICVSCALLLKEELITKDEHNEILKMLLKLQQKCKKILRDRHKVEGSCRLSHYTKVTTLNSILKGKDSNYLRLYDTAYFNDLEDGTYFFKAFDPSMHSYIYGDEDQISHEIKVEGKSFSAYVCSFTGKEDDLDMWRAYSNNGDGYSITSTISEDIRAAEEYGVIEKVIGLSLQANLDESSVSNMPKEEQPRLSSQDVQSKSSEPDVSKDNGKIHIYKVLYGEEDAAETYEILKEPLGKLQNLLKNMKDTSKKEVSKIIKNLAAQVIADLRYLYKDKPFSSEQECRIINVVDTSNEKLKHDNTSEPLRLYMETEPFLFKEKGCKITIGPCVKDKADALAYIKDQLHKNNWSETTEIVCSKINYRLRK